MHHLWQHGLYVGLHAVNGDDFWTEGLARELSPRFGAFRIVEPAVVDSGPSPSWRVVTRYDGSDGQPVLLETQTYRLVDHGDSYALDLAWTLDGVVDVTFEAWAYGGPFLRRAYREALGGLVLTSEGAADLASAEQRRARWVAVGMPLEERRGSARRSLRDGDEPPGQPGASGAVARRPPVRRRAQPVHRRREAAAAAERTTSRYRFSCRSVHRTARSRNVPIVRSPQWRTRHDPHDRRRRALRPRLVVRGRLRAPELGG